MEDILEEINAVVGVTGSFVCNDEGQILTGLMPDASQQSLLPSVGRTIAQTINGLKITLRRKVGDIDLLYEQGRLVVKSLQGGYLCILCACRINVPLLNLTANVAVKKLSERLKEAGPALVQEPAASAGPKSKRAAMAAEAEPVPQAEQQPESEPARRMTRAEMMAATLFRRR